MLKAVASCGDSCLWPLAVHGVLAVVSLSVYKCWQYLIEGQRQRAAERIACKIRPGTDVELDRRSSLYVRRDLAATGTGSQGRLPDRHGELLLVDMVMPDAHEEKPRGNGWMPPD
jgi:hypothetical protein